MQLLNFLNGTVKFSTPNILVSRLKKKKKKKIIHLNLLFSFKKKSTHAAYVYIVVSDSSLFKTHKNAWSLAFIFISVPCVAIVNYTTPQH